MHLQRQEDPPTVTGTLHPLYSEAYSATCGAVDKGIAGWAV